MPRLPKNIDPTIRAEVKAQLDIIASVLPITDDTKPVILKAMNIIHRALFLAGCDDYILAIHNNSPVLSYKMRSKNAPIGMIASGDAYALTGS